MRGFSATTEINRDDFGVDFNSPLEGGGLGLGRKIQIALEIEAVLQAPDALRPASFHEMPSLAAYDGVVISAPRTGGSTTIGVNAGKVANDGSACIEDSFKSFAESTREDWDLISPQLEVTQSLVADRILEQLRYLESDDGGFPVSRLEHSLQTASPCRARR